MPVDSRALALLPNLDRLSIGGKGVECVGRKLVRQEENPSLLGNLPDEIIMKIAEKLLFDKFVFLGIHPQVALKQHDSYCFKVYEEIEQMATKELQEILSLDKRCRGLKELLMDPQERCRIGLVAIMRAHDWTRGDNQSNLITMIKDRALFDVVLHKELPFAEFIDDYRFKVYTQKQTYLPLNLESVVSALGKLNKYIDKCNKESDKFLGFKTEEAAARPVDQPEWVYLARIKHFDGRIYEAGAASEYYERLKAVLEALVQNDGYQHLSDIALRHCAAWHAALYATEDTTEKIEPNGSGPPHFVQVSVIENKHELLKVKLEYLNFSFETDLSWMHRILTYYDLFNENVRLWNPIVMSKASLLFSQLKQFKGDGIDQWNLSQLKVANGMFDSCQELSVHNVRNWGLSKLKNARYMFSGCKKFNPETVGTWSLAELQEADNMFVLCTEFTGSGASDWELPQLKNGERMFAVCFKFNPGSVKGWQPNLLQNAAAMFCRCKEFTGTGIENWDLSNIVSADNMFSHCLAFNASFHTNCNLSNLRNAWSMFEGCKSFSGNGVEMWDLQNLERAKKMFFGCENFCPISLKCWNLQKLREADYMFSECTKFNPSEEGAEIVWREQSCASYMFSGCTNFEGCWLKNWNVANLKFVKNMFKGCTSLKICNLKNWNLTNVENSDQLKDIFIDVPLSRSDLTTLTTINLNLKECFEVANAIKHVFGQDRGAKLIREHEDSLRNVCRHWVTSGSATL